MKKILVIGDSSRDVFVYCDALRLCPDVPVPVLNIKNQTENPGMAMNVHRNIKNLWEQCDIVTNDNWFDITKTRYVHSVSNHTFFRVDTTQSISRIDMSSIDYEYDIIVISDYDKGFLTEEDIFYIGKSHPLTFLDTKKTLGAWAESVTYIKINKPEYERTKHVVDNNSNLKNKLIITLGSNGCSFKEKQFPVNNVEIKDLTGAGDTFLAALVFKFLIDGNIYDAINFANECATLVVQQKGVNTIQ